MTDDEAPDKYKETKKEVRTKIKAEILDILKREHVGADKAIPLKTLIMKLQSYEDKSNFRLRFMSNDYKIREIIKRMRDFDGIPIMTTQKRGHYYPKSHADFEIFIEEQIRRKTGIERTILKAIKLRNKEFPETYYEDGWKK